MKRQSATGPIRPPHRCPALHYLAQVVSKHHNDGEETVIFARKDTASPPRGVHGLKLKTHASPARRAATRGDAVQRRRKDIHLFNVFLATALQEARDALKNTDQPITAPSLDSLTQALLNHDASLFKIRELRRSVLSLYRTVRDVEKTAADNAEAASALEDEERRLNLYLRAQLADAGPVLSLDFSAEALDRCEESGRFTMFLLARSLLKPAVRELILPSGLEIRPRYLTPENFPELGKACLPYPEMESLDLSNMSGLTDIELLHPIDHEGKLSLDLGEHTLGPPGCRVVTVIEHTRDSND